MIIGGPARQHAEHAADHDRAVQAQGGAGERVLARARGDLRAQDVAHRIREQQHELRDDLRDGVGADGRERRERREHDHVEARVEEVQQGADLDAGAVAQRGRLDRARERDAVAREHADTAQGRHQAGSEPWR